MNYHEKKQYFPRFSPNHNQRPFCMIELIILHYTGMQTSDAALEWLCNPASNVSAHYFVEEDGTIFQLVEEDRRAWHAGVAHWQGACNINDISIGIEIANCGHEHGYTDFPAAQIEAVKLLCLDIMQRYELPAHSVVAHSDVAPTRKQDPGELFPWQELAKYGVGIWHDIEFQSIDIKSQSQLDVLQLDDLSDIDNHSQENIPQQNPSSKNHSTKNISDKNINDRNTGDRNTSDKNYLQKLQQFGYEIIMGDELQNQAVIIAFQRHFRCKNLSSEWDAECEHILNSLIKITT